MNIECFSNICALCNLCNIHFRFYLYDYAMPPTSILVNILNFLYFLYFFEKNIKIDNYS